MRYIIIGCGRWGAGLSMMLSHDGHQVVTVDRDPGSFARLGPAFKGRTIVGDGVDRAVLEEAGIKRA
ncbi:MAG: NAD-binding protein, partial [Bacteroidota bacterium]